MAHRTALIAAGSIAVVIVAGTIAVGANLGILNAADSHPVGKLSASTSIPATETTPVAVAVPVVSAAAVPQKYVIKKARCRVIVTAPAARDSAVEMARRPNRPGAPIV